MNPNTEIYATRKSSPKISAPLSPRACGIILGAIFVVMMTVAVFQVVRNHTSHARLESENKALSLALGKAQGEASRTPPGLVFFGTLGNFDIYAREKSPRVAMKGN